MGRDLMTRRQVGSGGGRGGVEEEEARRRRRRGGGGAEEEAWRSCSPATDESGIANFVPSVTFKEKKKCVIDNHWKTKPCERERGKRKTNVSTNTAYKAIMNPQKPKPTSSKIISLFAREQGGRQQH